MFFVPCFFLMYESRNPAIMAIKIMTHDSAIPIMSLLTIDTVMPITPIAARAYWISCNRLATCLQNQLLLKNQLTVSRTYNILTIQSFLITYKGFIVFF